jgi:hypothetical protein
VVLREEEEKEKRKKSTRKKRKNGKKDGAKAAGEITFDWLKLTTRVSDSIVNAFSIFTFHQVHISFSFLLYL